MFSTTTAVPVKHILCPVDFSEQSKLVVEHSIRVAEIFNADMSILNIIDDTAPEYATYRKTEQGMTTLRRTLEQDSQNRLTAQILPKFRNKDIKHTMVTSFGKATDQIPKFAREQNIGLILMATRSAGLTNQFILGSTTYKVVRTAPCPLMIFSRPEQKFRAVRILFPTDFSALSMSALSYAYRIAKEFDSDFHIVHFHQAHNELFKDSGTQLDTLKRDAQRNGITRLHIADDLKGISPGTAVLKYAKEHAIDLIVISAHGVGGYKQFFLGTAAIEISSRSECPVLIVRRPE